MGSSLHVLLAVLGGSLPATTPDGARLFVGGVEVPEAEVRRACVLLHGGKELQEIRLRLALEDGASRLGVAEGFDAFAGTLSELMRKVYFPESLADEADWPDLRQHGILDPYVLEQIGGFSRRLAASRRNEPGVSAPVELEWKIVEGWLREGLEQLSVARRGYFELPSSAVLAANGRVVRTAEVWPRIADRITPGQREVASRWLGALVAIGSEIERRGMRLTRGEWLASWERRYGSDASTDVALELDVLSPLRFPSNEAFRTREWMLQAYARHLLGPLTPERMRDFVERRGALLGNQELELEVILFSAWDFEKHEPLGPSARASSERAATACRARLDAGEDFAALLDELSQFEDLRPAPSPLFALTGVKPIETHRGRLGWQAYEGVAYLLGESPFEKWIQRADVARRAFEELERGRIHGPIPMTYGTGLVRVVNARSQPAGLDPSFPQDQAHLERWLLEIEFDAWTREVVARTGIELRGS